jgi:transcriptional regulator with XRE-family HTH domain
MRTKTIYSREYKILLAMLKDARVRKGVTQVQMASKLKVQQSAVGKYERGELRMDLIQLRNWLKALGISLTDFVAEYEDAL